MNASVLLADDHTLFTDVLAHFLWSDFVVVGIARTGQMMVDLARQHKPNVILVDISMPGLNGIDAARIVLKELPSTKVLMLSMHGDIPLVEEAVRAGARGFVLKLGGAAEVLQALRTVAKGGKYITPLLSGDVVASLMAPGHEESSETRLTLRQRHVLQLLAEGKTMKEAATAMDISVRTAESHKYEIMRKMGFRTTAELIRYAIQIKLV